MASSGSPLLGGDADLEYGGRGGKRGILPAVAVVALIVSLIAAVVTLAVLYAEATDSDEDEEAVWGCLAKPFDPVTPAQRSGAHADNRAQMKSQWTPPSANDTSVFVLWGLSSQTLAGTDTDLVFLQESNFLYISGVTEPGCILAFFVDTAEWTLFVPRREDSYAVWNGYILSLSAWQANTGATSVLYTDQFQAYVTNLTTSFAADNGNGNDGQQLVFYTMPNLGTAANINQTLPADLNLTMGASSVMQLALDGSRILKTPVEQQMLEIAASVSAQAHVAVMEYVRPGMFEYQAESRFLDFTGSCSLSVPSYLPIVGAGYNSAILHYIENGAEMNTTNMLLIDAACDYLGYASDITRTYPVNGCFSQQQKTVYQMVLNVQNAAIEQIAPGVSWSLISANANRQILQELVDNNFLQGNVTQMYSLGCNLLFMNHGLGHTVGIDVHDSKAGTTLLERMVYTVEPGIYFNEVLLVEQSPRRDACLQFFVAETIDWYLTNKFGGVRIEDVVLVEPAPTNSRILSQAVPREIKDIEQLMDCKHK